MCEFNQKITIAELLRLTIFSAKSKIYSPRQGYLSPGNSIVLKIAATFLFISVTKLKHASNRPVYFRDLRTCCLQSTTTKTLPYHISTHVCTLHNMILKFTKAGNITKTFSSEKFIEANNIFAIRGKKPFLFQSRACKQDTQSVSQSICN